jgi:hypothetical protein
MPLIEGGARTGLAASTTTGQGVWTEGAGLLHKVTSLLHLHPQARTKCQPVMHLQCALHRDQWVLHQITRPMHQTNILAMVQEVDQTIRMPHPLATNLVTKVTLVATCRVGQAQLVRATTLDTMVEGLETCRRPLSQVTTSLLLTKAVVPSTKAKQVTRATKATRTTTMQPHLPTRGGMGRGGSTNREHC